MTTNVPPEQAEAELSVERCEIAHWRGYLTSAFYARRVDDGVPVTESSRSFRWRRSAPPPDEPFTKRALADVVAALEQKGWLETGRGSEWFSKRFERLAPRAASAPPPPEPEGPAANELPPLLPPLLPPPLPPEYMREPVPLRPPAAAREEPVGSASGRHWQVAAMVALPGAFALLGWLVAGGG